MALAPGSRLGPYTITSRIGAGGMGEVYRAVDSRLERDVAIKVLPSELSNNAQLKLRFSREARTISQLNHPNICTIHDVGDEDGTSFLVMELLEGETLADRLARGPLSVADVVLYGSQIAEGLDRAHRSGIVHRDLKPANIMITRSGAKLLDFGLAKPAFVSIGPNDMTQQKPLTAEGTIVGTFQYMAPEQIEGLEADARSDIFALGAVLYEMITGKRAFDGKTKTSLIAAIVASQPPAISHIQPLAPSSLEHVVTRCLQKDPEERWQSARDVAHELKWSPGTVDAPRAAPPRKWLLPLLVLLLLTAAATTTLYLREKGRPREMFAFAVEMPDGTQLGHFALSPDGRHIAFTTFEKTGEETALWVRSVNATEPRQLAKGVSVFAPGKPFWSPDSRFIGFYERHNIMKISVDGARPELVCGGCGYGVGATWSGDGTILFAPRFNDGLFQVAASGGESKRLTSLDRARKETIHAWPVFLPDSDHYLYLVHTTADQTNQIRVGSLKDGSHRPLLNAASLVGFAKGDLLYVRDGAMFAQAFDERKLTLSGEPRKIVEEVHFSEENAHADATVADNGALVYAPASNALRTVDVSLYDASGKHVQKLFEDVSIGQLWLSHDESRIAMKKWNSRKGAFDVYTRDLTRGVETRLTSGLSNHDELTWAANDDRILFSSDRAGMYDIYTQPDDSASPAQVVLKDPEDKHPSDISPDGKYLLYRRTLTATRADLWLHTTDRTAKERALVTTEGDESDALFSPDGRWITYTTDVTGRREVYVRPFPEGRSTQVSIDGGLLPRWSTDGRTVIFSTPRFELVAAKLNVSSAQARPEKPELLFALSPNTFWWTTTKRTDRFLIATTPRPYESEAVINYVSQY